MKRLRELDTRLYVEQHPVKARLALGVLVLGFLVANGLDHEARVLDNAAQCSETEVLVETLSTTDQLIERVWACVPIASVRPVGRYR